MAVHLPCLANLVIPPMTGWLEQRARREGIDNHMEMFIEEAIDLAAAQPLLQPCKGSSYKTLRWWPQPNLIVFVAPTR
jgi:hypothetical protein